MPGFDKSGIDAIQSAWRDSKEEIWTDSVFTPLETEWFMPMETQDEEILPNSSTSEVVQSFQEAWTEKGDVAVGGRVLKVRDIKVDFKIVPKLYSTNYYYSFLRTSGNDPHEFPWERWVLMQLLNRYFTDLEVLTKWQGVYSAPTPGTANNAVDVADGFEALITAMGLTAIVTGVIAAGTAFSQVEDFVYTAIDTKAKNRFNWACYCSEGLKDKYVRDYRNTHGTDTHADEFGQVKIPGKNVWLVPQDGLSGDELRLTRQGNFHVGHGGPVSIEFYKHLRSTYIAIDGKIGFQAQTATASEIYTNDQ